MTSPAYQVARRVTLGPWPHNRQTTARRPTAAPSMRATRGRPATSGASSSRVGPPAASRRSEGS
eukprot:5558611-Prymnesium_polylepis.1